MTVCLSTIVKNEAPIIRRCLSSVLAHIDCWAISDTGSTDGTQGIVRDVMSGVPGELIERPWRDFASNRQDAMDLARMMGTDYVLIMDADEWLVPSCDRPFDGLTADQYNVDHRREGCLIELLRPSVVKASIPWKWQGVLHECLTGPWRTKDRLRTAIIDYKFDGARNADQQTKFERDAEVLERALADDPTNARYRFYLAQSYRDAGDVARAEAAYIKRADMGGWVEEVYVSWLRIAALRIAMGKPRADVIDAYLRAHSAQPLRAEALCDLARYCRLSNDFVAASIFAREAGRIPRPDDALFLDHSEYEYRAFDELSVASYLIGNYRDAADMARLALHSSVDGDARVRIHRNYDVSTARLRGLR